MASYYDKKIDRYTDWGGDKSTGYLPVKGSRVQEFIKDEFSQKIGRMYKSENNTCYCFANTDDYNAWIASGRPEESSLIIDQFVFEAKYEVIYSAVSPTYNNVILGTTGNSFTYKVKVTDIKTETEKPETKVRVVYTCTKGGVTVGTDTKEYDLRPDLEYTEITYNGIDDFITDEGTYVFTYKITGINTGAESLGSFTYNIYDITYTTDFSFKDAATGSIITIPYTATCKDTKYLEWYIDGTLVGTADTIVATDERSTKTLNIDAYEEGRHTLQTRAYVIDSNKSKFYTNLYYYTFAKGGSDAGNVFLMGLLLPSTHGIVAAESALTFDSQEFDNVNFNWAVYNGNGLNVQTKIEYDSSSLFSGETSIGTLYNLSFRPMHSGSSRQLKITMTASGITDEEIIYLDVAKSDAGIRETTNGLKLKLNGNGKYNESNPDVWEYSGTYGTFKTSFSGFSWNSQCGWNNGSLVMSNGAHIEIDLAPMATSWTTGQGGTIEFEFESFDSQSDDAVICKMHASGTSETFRGGFEITSTSAKIMLSDGTYIESRYKNGDHMKLAFICNPTGKSENDNLVYIVINGVLERAMLYDTATLQYLGNLTFGNPDGEVSCRLKSIRCYDRAISVDEEFNNYVIDSDEVQYIYEKNNVLKDGSSTEIDLDKIKSKIPVMIFTGPMPDILKRKEKMDDWLYFDVEYTHNTDPSLNFVSFHARVKTQGTSSLGYPRKNLKLNTKDSNCTQENFNLSRFVYSGDTIKRLFFKDGSGVVDINDFSTTDGTWTFSGDTILNKGKYRFRKGSTKVNKWTLKADFMESSSSHNTGAGNSWNDIFRNTKLTIQGQGVSGYTNNTYKDSARVHTDRYTYSGKDADDKTYQYTIDEPGLLQYKDYVCMTEAQKTALLYENSGYTMGEVRTAIDGFPMVCFYRLTHDSDLVFMGQYNFNNDKSNTDVFGFESIEDPANEGTDKMVFDGRYTECWEGLSNTESVGLFHRVDTFAETRRNVYESRYPEEDESGEGKRTPNATALNELCKWLVSTRHSGDTIYDASGNTITPEQSDINIDSSFACRINDYQYGYTDETKESFVYASGTVKDNAVNRQKKFETEKWEHFDVWKLAGYYIYLMRYGAVDQFVKNTMLTTEGNGKYDKRDSEHYPQYRKWYFINYDNDCLFGLRNNGELAFKWDMDRQTVDGNPDPEFSGQSIVYAMMGHSSTLWNNLEADNEFMRMVRDLDNSMSNNGLNYDGMVKAFDTNQTDKWCERVYNANERYKYIYSAKGIGDMSGNPENDLWMLQGTRKSHRHWWISNRFSLYNAKWLSGDYKNNNIEMKIDTEDGELILASAGTDYYFAWGTARKLIDSNMERSKGEAIVFSGETKLVQGDPLYIYAPHKMDAIDFSNIAHKCKKGSFNFQINDTETQNYLKRLIVGNKNKANTDIVNENLTTWSKLTALEYIDITNFRNITYVPIGGMNNLHTFLASGTSYGSFEPADGVILNKVVLPNTLQGLKLHDVQITSWDETTGFTYRPTAVLDTLEITGTSINLTYYNNLVYDWLGAINQKSAEEVRNKTLNIGKVDWSFGSFENIWIFEKIKKYGKFNITGKISLSDIGSGFTVDTLNRIKDLFGEECFNPESTMYVVAPSSVFISCNKESAVAGDTNVQFSQTTYPTPLQGDTITYSVSGDLRGSTVSINSDTGKLSSVENIIGRDSTIDVQVILTRETQTYPDSMTFVLKDPTYPDSGKTYINGETALYDGDEKTYTLKALTSAGTEAIGTHITSWIISGESGYEQYIKSSGLTDQDNLNLSITGSPEIAHSIILSATVRHTEVRNNQSSTTEFVVSKQLLVLNSNVAISRVTNPFVFNALTGNTWYLELSGATEDALMKVGAAQVTNDQLAELRFSGTIGGPQFSFNELKYFSGITEIQYGIFNDSRLTSIVLPKSISSLADNVFKNCYELTDVGFDEYTPNLTVIPKGCFLNNQSISAMTLPNYIKEIKNLAFGGTNIEYITTYNDSEKKGLVVPDTFEKYGGYAFSTGETDYISDNKLIEIHYGKSVTEYGVYMVNGLCLKHIEVDGENTTYNSINGALYNNNNHKIFKYPALKSGSTAALESDCDEIAAFCFTGTKYLKEIELGNTVGTIGNYAFSDSSIERFEILEGNQKISLIPYGMFKNSSALTEVVIPNDSMSVLTSIGSQAFCNCNSLSALSLPDKVTNMGGYCIDRCNALTEFVFPKYVKINNEFVINGCSALTSVTLPYCSYINESEEEVIVNEGYKQQFVTCHAYNATTPVDTAKPCASLVEFKMRDDDTKKYFTVSDGVVYNINSENSWTLLSCPFGKTSITVNPKCTIISDLAFNGNSKLTYFEASPYISSINTLAFHTTNISEYKFYSLDLIGNNALGDSRNKIFTIMGLSSEGTCPYLNTNAFGYNTGVTVYVPTAYKPQYDSNEKWIASNVTIREITSSAPLMTNNVNDKDALIEELLKRIENLENKIK